MKGCRVTVSVYFVVLIACIVILDPSGLALLALLCAAFHEAGHFAALWFFKVPVEEVSFRLFGIGIKMRQKKPLAYPQEAVVALAGCTVNLVLALLSLLIRHMGLMVFQATVFALMNFLIAGFNLLPIGPLDGGRAVEAGLSYAFGVGVSKKVVDVLSALLMLPLVFFGVYVVAQTGYNFSLILAALYLMITLVFKGSLLHIE